MLRRWVKNVLKGGADVYALESQVQELRERVDLAASARASSARQEAIRLTLPTPIEVPQEPPGAFFIHVKVDHAGVFRPNQEAFIYREVERVFGRHESRIRDYVVSVKKAAEAAGYARITEHETNARDPFLNNPMFQGADARALYGMICHLKPQRIVEVGSGHSSRFICRAVRDAGLTTDVMCIDPVPRSDLASIGARVMLQSVQNADRDVFRTLEAGDILFWDGAHIAFNGTDVTMLFLEVLPILARGVHVHIHDIMLPDEYNPTYSAHYYNEQYMLATLLLNSAEWHTTLPLHYVGSRIAPEWAGCSFWMTKERL